ncbi:MAG: hypothetical protein ACOC10_10695 [Bacteroidota bacterium]
MLSTLIAGIVFLFVVVVALHLFRNNPVLVFMFMLAVLTNVGGYFEDISMGSFLLRDIAFLLSFLIMFVLVPKVNIHDRYFKNFLWFVGLLIFYQIFVSLLVMNNFSPAKFFGELIDIRLLIFGTLVSIPVYFIVQYDTKTFLKIINYTGLILLVLFFLTLFAGIDLMQISYYDRGMGTGARRIGMAGLGYASLMPYIALAIYLLKVDIEHKKLFYIVGILTFLSVFITLTRQTNIKYIGGAIILMYFIKATLNINIKKLLTGTISLLVVVSVVAELIFPGYLSSFYTIIKLTFLEATGQVAAGTTQSRTTYEYVAQLPLFLEHPVWGTGLTRIWFTGGQYERSDIPLLSSLAIFGIIGFGIYLIQNVIVLKRAFIMRKYNLNHAFVNENAYELVLLFAIIAVQLTGIFFSFFNFGKELVAVNSKLVNGVYLGIFFGLFRKVDLKLYSRMVQINNNNDEKHTESSGSGTAYR